MGALSEALTGQLTRQLVRVRDQMTEIYSLLAEQGQAEAQVLVIPGNPGAAGYYKPFMQSLYDFLDRRADIFAVSQLGTGVPSHSEVRLFSLQEQIEHKRQFLSDFLCRAGRPPLVIMGHSIGAYMAMHALYRMEKDPLHNGASLPCVSQVIGLMPFLTIDPASRQQRLLQRLTQYPRLFGTLAELLRLLPSALLRLIVRGYAGKMDAHAVEATLSLINRASVSNALFLGQHEFADLAAPADWWLMQHLGGRLSIIGAPQDMWMPLWKWEQMLLQVPDVKAILVHDLSHAFCASLTESQRLAGIVAGQMRQAL